jgi:hypothetical protein
MARTVEKNVGEIALLMHNSAEIALKVEPGCRWLPRKPSLTTKRRVLGIL